ncbi:hypothetical protein [Stutzerimonas balearica]|jgi:hypothetical protein|uniref:Uncharacterized protein n=1 Tax=Stutzerimonas balearica DSM 6083 TaxID=1123016 RepID=A0ABY0QU89_9GAMM|nr:hypothetical protein SAMN05660875_10167 [Stutzerimonas balearica DSM 6083]
MMVSERTIFVSERGRESIESINQTPGPSEQDPETSITNGEVSGGTEYDVPGGAYNVPPGMADEVSDEEALHQERRPCTPER